MIQDIRHHSVEFKILSNQIADAEAKLEEAKKHAPEDCKECSELKVRGIDETLYYCFQFYTEVDPDNCYICQCRKLISKIDCMNTPIATNIESGNYNAIQEELERIINLKRTA